MLDHPNIFPNAGAVPNSRAADFSRVINWLMICSESVISKFAAVSAELVRC
jgi:hypothetical protein